ncbi:hypothetical protein HUU42_02775 [bacterium]|nr:hypothetical protein [bacterium]
MKVILIYLVFAITSLNSLAAQIRFGIKSGVTLADQTEAEFSPARSRMGLNISAFIEYSFHRHLSLQAESGYDQKGYRHTEGDVKIGDRLNYWVSSARVKMDYPLTKWAAYLAIGLRYDRLVSKKIGNTMPVVLLPDKNSGGLVFAGGLEVKNVFPVTSIIEVSFNPDFTTLYRYPHTRNRTIELKLGVKL